MKATTKAILDAGRAKANAPTHGVLIYDNDSPTGWRIYANFITRRSARKIAERMNAAAGNALRHPETGLYAIAECHVVVKQHPRETFNSPVFAEPNRTGAGLSGAHYLRQAAERRAITVKAQLCPACGCPIDENGCGCNPHDA